MDIPLTPPTLDSIQTPVVPTKLTLNSPQEMGSYQDLTKKPKPILKGLSVPFAVICINLCILVTWIFWGWSKITTFAIQRDGTNQRIVDIYKSRILQIDNIINYPGINSLIQATEGTVSQVTFDTLLPAPIPFIFKRDIAEEKVFNFANQLLTDAENLNKIQEDIAKYGFLHQDVMNLLAPEEDAIPITTLLHTIETVKFWTSLKIFSLLDTFLTQTSRLLSIDKADLSEAMETYTQRGEKDIDRFLSTCYLNPYETLPDCNQIGDFANYFRYDEKDATIDSKLLSKVLVVISNKLEQSDLPSLQIAFDNFSPKAKALWFNVTINTLPEDETAFLAKWIINPHIFIISTLVNLLKQSIFVIGNTINVNKLNIQQKMFTVGDVQIPVSTSSMKFNLPLQWSSEREIYDYYDFATLNSWQELLIDQSASLLSWNSDFDALTGDIMSWVVDDTIDVLSSGDVIDSESTGTVEWTWN
jgi:hypothetical protein